MKKKLYLKKKSSNDYFSLFLGCTRDTQTIWWQFRFRRSRCRRLWKWNRRRKLFRSETSPTQKKERFRIPFPTSFLGSSKISPFTSNTHQTHFFFLLFWGGISCFPESYHFEQYVTLKGELFSQLPVSAQECELWGILRTGGIKLRKIGKSYEGDKRRKSRWNETQNRLKQMRNHNRQP